jgi:hypothetical protein
MARIIPLTAALSRPMTSCTIHAAGPVTIIGIPSSNVTIQFHPHDVCVIVEDLGNGAHARTVTDYIAFPLPTGIAYAVSPVYGDERIIVPTFTIRLHHDGTVSTLIQAPTTLPPISGAYHK